ncbi:MAG: argininosuccinate lyase [Methanococcaceae archaeon]
MLWGGRFKEKLSTDAMKFSSSLSFDKNLILEDIQVSRVHAAMLSHISLITPEESRQIIDGLNRIEAEYTAGIWQPEEDEYEDIHSAIEARLTLQAGPAAGKLHTGRSRNDQVATGMRLWVKKAVLLLNENLKTFQSALIELASEHTVTIMPGYTHLQRAQPISFAFHLLAYVEMLQRDIERLNFTSSESDHSPLGAGALAGSTLPLDREYTAENLGFKGPSANALDAVSDRDYMIDFLNCAAVGMMHLSRLAEEIVLWSTKEWNFVRLADAYSTGSSLMPQKKNPDMAELIRGKSGRVYGNYISLMTTMKGLPLSYNRDMQEDKEPLFDSFQTYFDSVSIVEKMISTMQVNKDRFTEELKNDFSLATDLADWLVLKGVPFRESHGIVGRLVQYAEANGVSFDTISLGELKNIHPVFDETALKCLKLETALERKKTYGSPNPVFVKESIENWKKKLSA